MNGDEIQKNDFLRGSSPAVPKLWNPETAATLSVLLSPIFGAWLHARNWKELGRLDNEKKSMRWFYAYCIIGIICLFSPKDIIRSSFWWNLLLVFPWYFSSAKPQVRFIKENFNNYEKRPFGKPVFLCFAFGAVYFVAAYGVLSMTDDLSSSDTEFNKIYLLAEEGDADAQRELALMYAAGNGVNKDIEQTMEWLGKAANQGDVRAQLVLGSGYLGRYTDIPKDYLKAEKWLRRAAEQGNGDAQGELALIFSEGLGFPVDYKESVRWLRRAVANDVVAAIHNLGHAYAEGQGVPKDEKKAFELFLKSAQRGLADSQFNVGLYYHQGIGVKQDFEEALKWYRKAAKQGYAQAQINLGIMYENGEGVPQNDIQAFQWYNIAAASGNELAIEYRDESLKTLDDKEIAEGQRLATEWVRANLKQ